MERAADPARSAPTNARYDLLLAARRPLRGVALRWRPAAYHPDDVSVWTSSSVSDLTPAHGPRASAMARPALPELESGAEVGFATAHSPLRARFIDGRESRTPGTGVHSHSPERSDSSPGPSTRPRSPERYESVRRLTQVRAGGQCRQLSRSHHALIQVMFELAEGGRKSDGRLGNVASQRSRVSLTTWPRSRQH